MPFLAIIADDLTGANDTGVQFAKSGLKTHVIITADGIALSTDADVVVLATDSRGLAPDTAYKKVTEAADALKKIQLPIVYKKVDSTLRGNLGAEIDALLDSFGFECAVVAPAYPRIGRITVGGYHLLHQIPLQTTEIARDPVAPVTESRLDYLLKAQSKYTVSHVTLSDVLGGPEQLINRLNEYCRNGSRLISFDATEAAHLEVVAKAVHGSGKNVLWVGSAGLAEALPAVYSLPVRAAQPWQQSRGLPVLVVCGSVSNVTANQIAAFLTQPDSALVEVDAARLIDQAAEEIDRCVKMAQDLLRQNLNTAIVSPHHRDKIAAAYACGEKLGLEPAAVSEQVARGIGLITRQLADAPIEGLFLTGGDTAVNVCYALGAASMEVFCEVSTGIPFGRLSSGPYRGLKVVTKAGAFGDEQAIIRSVAMIRSGNE